MARWMCLLVLALPLLAGCSGRTTTSEPAQRPGLFTLDTDLGPVDVLGFENDGGTRTIRVHAEYSEGHHAVRTLRLDVAEDPSNPNATRFVQSIEGGGEPVRITQSVTDETAGLDAVYEAGGETLRLLAATEGSSVRFRAELRRGADVSTWEKLLDPALAREPEYVRVMQASFADFYGNGPFRDNEDVALLIAVEESRDWSDHLREVPLGPEHSQTQTQRNIHRLCTVAGVVGKITCFASKFTPWAMFGCVPATGISIACLAYDIYQLTLDPDPLDPLPEPPLPCTCGCTCGDDYSLTQPAGGRRAALPGFLAPPTGKPSLPCPANRRLGILLRLNFTSRHSACIASPWSGQVT